MMMTNLGHANHENALLQLSCITVRFVIKFGLLNTLFFQMEAVNTPAMKTSMVNGSHSVLKSLHCALLTGLSVLLLLWEMHTS